MARRCSDAMCTPGAHIDDDTGAMPTHPDMGTSEPRPWPDGYWMRCWSCCDVTWHACDYWFRTLCCTACLAKHGITEDAWRAERWAFALRMERETIAQRKKEIDRDLADMESVGGL